MAIRIEIGCWNCDCVHYYEGMCMKDWRENEVMFHDRYGKCISFEEGKNECYELENINNEGDC